MPTAADKLTPNFTYGELRAHTAPAIYLPNLQATARKLEQLRAIIGVPLKVTSGYRAPEYNAALPGASKTSSHMTGQAADFKPLGMNVLTAYNKLKQAYAAGQLNDFDQIIYYPLQHLHVGIGPQKRQQFLIRITEGAYTLDIVTPTPNDMQQGFANTAVIFALAFLALAFIFGTVNK